MTVAKCPICESPAAGEHRPFCSRRCRDIDLRRWLTGRYVIPDEGEEDGEGRPGDEG